MLIKYKNKIFDKKILVYTMSDNFVTKSYKICQFQTLYGEFDPGSE